MRPPALPLRGSRARATLALALSTVSLAVGCTGAPPPEPQTPVAPPPTTEAPRPPLEQARPEPPRDPFAVRGELRDEPESLQRPHAAALTLHPWPALPKTVPAAPKTCGAYVRRAARPAAKCADRASLLARLDTALAETDADKRDAKLASLETCAGAPEGLVRALRADLAPTECGDVLVQSVAEKPSKGISSAVYETLLGQALAGRLARLPTEAPKLTAPFDKQRVLDFLKGPLATWLVAQAGAVQETSQLGAKLSSYGRAVAAVEAGMADMRLADSLRSLPLPEEFAKDPELKNIFYAALEEALEPRKARGRDAALVGIGDFAGVGAISDARADRARTLLSKLYGGRRIDALDALLLPPLPAASAARVEERLAARLPTFYAGQLFEPKVASDPAILRALLARGVPGPMRGELRGTTDPALRALFARARFGLAQRYWRVFDFDQVAALTRAPEGTARSDEATLLLALALALRAGPANAADMMHRAPLTALGVSDTAALDAIAKSQSPLAAMAAFDAALLREISPPETAGADYWADVEARFRDAGARLTDPAHKKAADEGAKAAAALRAAVADGSKR